MFWSIFGELVNKLPRCRYTFEQGCNMDQLLVARALKSDLILVNFAIFAIFGPDNRSQIIVMCQYF